MHRCGSWSLWVSRHSSALAGLSAGPALIDALRKAGPTLIAAGVVIALLPHVATRIVATCGRSAITTPAPISVDPGISQRVDQGRWPGLRPASARNAASPSDSRSHSDASRILPNRRIHRPQISNGEAAEETPTGALMPSSSPANVAVGRPIATAGDGRRHDLRSVADEGNSAKPISSATRAMFAPAPVTVRISPRSTTVPRVNGSSRPAPAARGQVDAARFHFVTEGAQRGLGELTVGHDEIGRDARDVEQLGIVDLVAQRPRAREDCRPAAADGNHVVSLEACAGRHLDERGPAAEAFDRHRSRGRAQVLHRTNRAARQRPGQPGAPPSRRIGRRRRGHPPMPIVRSSSLHASIN